MVPDIPLSLYIHFPWCVKKCPYCDFNSHALRGEVPEVEYIDALIQDFEQQLRDIAGRVIDTVFMGGGTPSLISAKQISRLMAALHGSGQLAVDTEITLEANPGTLDEFNFPAYLQAGVNRLSIGVQSFHDKQLQKIGRIHTAGQAHSAIVAAQTAGFERINLDLMYGLPGQSPAHARADIEQALATGVRHLSVYQLTLEPNTEFAVRSPVLPDSEQYWAMHQQAYQLLSSAGFEQYEVSAYSRGDACRHNVNYWRFGDYLAIGAGAHGKLSARRARGVLDIRRYWNHRQPKAYMQAAMTGSFCAETKEVPQAERDFEFLMNSLRLKNGFTLTQYQQTTGQDGAQLMTKLKPFVEKDFLCINEDRIFTSETGYRFLDTLLMEFLPESD